MSAWPEIPLESTWQVVCSISFSRKEEHAENLFATLSRIGIA